MLRPVIPETVTVHLGRPDEPARNVTVPFTDYIKNVASSEIYPTWPESALIANIYAEISYALNRIYTEYYPSRGYDFDITNSTTIDQSFVYGRNIFENISRLVDEIFDTYIRRQGSVEPLFALYCDGIEVQCGGLSQWGSVELAERGLSAFEILQNYFGDNIELVVNVPIEGSMESYPGEPLSAEMFGDGVYLVQIRLNRISKNFPNIPKIADVNGFFSAETVDAVEEFQRQFGLTPDGIVGRATWYAIARVYAAVKKLSDLNSEGVPVEDVILLFNDRLYEG
ncbi:MAG: peptidoglycan-binding protein, partial [Clostridia bacterium]|nr:peptidoglycan-binding protein [Clostridia bacterium]